MSGAAGREGEAADPRGPHLAAGGRKSGSVSSGSSGVMPAAAEHPRTVAAPASAASAAGGANGARTRPQPELTNRSTEPVAKLTGPELRPPRPRYGLGELVVKIVQLDCGMSLEVWPSGLGLS